MGFPYILQRPVIDLTTGRIYQNIAEASIHLQQPENVVAEFARQGKWLVKLPPDVIYCRETGQKFANFEEAARVLRVNPGTVRLSVETGFPARGHTFERAKGYTQEHVDALKAKFKEEVRLMWQD